MNLIAAVSENGVIGKGNGLPWNDPKDLKFFKELTTGHIVVMGHNTFKSIGRPLPNRTNIILSRDPTAIYNGAYTLTHIRTAEFFLSSLKEEVFVIGGAQIYREFLDAGLIKRCYITKMRFRVKGDTLFPWDSFNKFDWVEKGKRQLSMSAEAIRYDRKEI